WTGAVSLDGEGAPLVAVANSHEVRLANGATLPFPGGTQATAPAAHSLLAVDFNYDFKSDLVLAGAGGVRLFKQDAPDKFTDVTAQTKLPPALTGAAYSGAWAADIDADGDMDIVLGSQGETVVLRNNGDGTFQDLKPFEGSTGLSDFVWADLDADGDADAALLDSRGLQVYLNERGGQFRARAMPPNLSTVNALTTADVNGDGKLDLLALRNDGAILRASDKNETEWDVAEIARAESPSAFTDGESRLFATDLDNNGSIDLILSRASLAPTDAGCPPVCPTTSVWLSDQSGKFSPLKSTIPARLFSITDLDADGRLDLAGAAKDESSWKIVRLLNRGSKNYHWQQVRPRAAQATGDQRINSFGIGGEMEIRSGLLVQKQLITGPLVHFGLGEQQSADVVRIVWPNGSVRAEFDLKADQTVVTEQRLKGSCPFLFAYDGHGMQFVKDAVPWGSAIGLRINTLGTARVEATEEWYKIAGDQLQERDGYYDLRITAELWETYYYDQLALTVVDHP
ncbi:MAG TPA: CRTAC1 family protein, partial [Pyrinomonadaceae bacterium]|nr:CRTAC1 family protein [Pyrinomonadaceae bacterium]